MVYAIYKNGKIALRYAFYKSGLRDFLMIADLLGVEVVDNKFIINNVIYEYKEETK